MSDNATATAVAAEVSAAEVLEQPVITEAKQPDTKPAKKPKRERSPLERKPTFWGRIPYERKKSVAGFLFTAPWVFGIPRSGMCQTLEHLFVRFCLTHIPVRL